MTGSPAAWSIRRAVGGEFAVGGQRIRRRGHQQPVHSGLAGGDGESRAVIGVQGVHSGQQRQPLPDDVAQAAELLQPLLAGQRVKFAGGAARNQAVDAAGNLKIDHLAPRRPVNRAVRAERRDERGVDSLESHVFFSCVWPAAENCIEKVYNFFIAAQNFRRFFTGGGFGVELTDEADGRQRESEGGRAGA